MLLCYTTAQTRAAENLDCPKIGPGHVPDLIGDTRGGGLLTTENFIDLANEIIDAISRQEVGNPDISSAPGWRYEKSRSAHTPRFNWVYPLNC